jgi:hypothetical protein
VKSKKVARKETKHAIKREKTRKFEIKNFRERNELRSERRVRDENNREPEQPEYCMRMGKAKTGKETEANWRGKPK